MEMWIPEKKGRFNGIRRYRIPECCFYKGGLGFVLRLLNSGEGVAYNWHPKLRAFWNPYGRGQNSLPYSPELPQNEQNEKSKTQNISASPRTSIHSKSPMTTEVDPSTMEQIWKLNWGRRI